MNPIKLFLMFFVIFCACTLSFSQITGEDAVKSTDLVQRLDQKLPLDAVFYDESAQEKRLGDFFSGKPVILTLVYYQCPRLCHQILNGLLKAVRLVNFTAGKEYDIILVSIDPRETPDLASRKKESYVTSYNRKGAENGWHFLTGTEENIRKVADAIGYSYIYDSATDQYVHPAGLIVLTPTGVTSKYFYGIEYSPRDLEFALMESSKERIGSLVQQVILYCFAYDPATGKYGFVVIRAMQLMAILTVIALGAFIFINVRKEKKLIKADIEDQIQNSIFNGMGEQNKQDNNTENDIGENK